GCPTRTGSRRPPEPPRSAHTSAGSAPNRCASARADSRASSWAQGTPGLPGRQPARVPCPLTFLRGSSDLGSCGRSMEEVIDPAGGFRTDAGNLLQVGDRCPLDRLEGAEVPQQRAFAGRAYAGDFLEAGFAQVAPTPLPVRADCKAMRLVAQPLDEIEHRIARPELERLAPGHEEGLAPGVALGTFGDGDDGHVANAERVEGFARGRELAEAAIDQHQARPGRRVLIVVRRILQSGRRRLGETADRRRGI